MGGNERDEGEIATIFADEVEYEDTGETIRCRIYERLPGGRRSLRQSIVMPRSGFMLSLIAAADRFLDRRRGCAGRVVTLICAGLTLH